MDNLTFLMQCIAFQNDHAKDNYNKNKKGIYGNEDTQKLARECTFDQWLLHAIYWDLEPTETNNIKYGIAGNHVWVSHAETDKRIAMIFVRDNKLVAQFENPAEFPKVVQSQFDNDN